MSSKRLITGAAVVAATALAAGAASACTSSGAWLNGSFSDGYPLCAGDLNSNNTWLLSQVPGLSMAHSWAQPQTFTTIAASQGIAGPAGSSATIAAGASGQVGTGATVACATSHVCDQISGEITLTTGTGSLSAGTIATITFPVTRTNMPNCITRIVGGTTYLGEGGVENTSGVTFSAAVALSASTTYTLKYICGGV